MSVQVRPPQGEGAKRLNAAVNRIAAGIARHWLAIFNVMVAFFVGLPFLAPVLMEAGATGPANLIYRVYAFTCHQLPERSIFFYGHDHFYTIQTLEAEGFLPAGASLFQRQVLRWPGSTEAGWKVALCQRDVAIYASILISGLLFGLVRSMLRPRARWPQMPVWVFVLLLAPIAIDGISQLLGWRDSFPLLRFFTGALMGSATVWFAYPHIEEAMQDVIRTTRTNT